MPKLGWVSMATTISSALSSPKSDREPAYRGSIFPLNLFDDTHQPLDGSNKYTIPFHKDAMPPVNADAFRSITLYDKDGFQIANSLHRFAVNGWMPFKCYGDGSLDLYLQNESAGADLEANWLPAANGPFNLTMRLYAPGMEALTGKCNPPPAVNEQGTPLLQATTKSRTRRQPARAQVVTLPSPPARFAPSWPQPMRTKRIRRYALTSR
jgi:Protein of unknown function (DUF1214)